VSQSNYYGLILAGGRGTRFWPRSRRKQAKQVLSFLDEQSLIQLTVERLSPILPPDRIWVLTNEHLRDEIVRQLPDVPKKQIIAEPEQRNTAPAIGLAAHILNSIDRDSVMGVFPSDHIIRKPARYVRLLRPAFKAAEQGKIAVLGIQPRWAETGYGYIEFPKGTQPGTPLPAKVESFREKPDIRTARRFLMSGNFYWNAGMFFWSTEVLLDALRRHLPKTFTLLAALPPFHSRNFGARLAETYGRCENISVDYAVMEKAENVVGIAADDIGWNDVGSWNALYELLPHDRDGNAVASEAILQDASGNYVDCRGKLIALLGVKDLVIVDTTDALLIAAREQAQKVGDLVKLLEKQGREELL
jgi:mannose-1-phosphate guanylyltransferase